MKFSKLVKFEGSSSQEYLPNRLHEEIFSSEVFLASTLVAATKSPVIQALLTDWLFPRITTGYSWRQHCRHCFVDEHLVAEGELVLHQISLQWELFISTITDPRLRSVLASRVTQPSHPPQLSAVEEDANQIARLWRLREPLRRYWGLPVELKRRIAFFPHSRSAGEIAGLTAKAAAIEYATSSAKKLADVTVLLPLILDSVLMQTLSDQGLVAALGMVAAVLSAEIISYAGQRSANRNVDFTTRSVSTFLHKALLFTPEQSALAQRIFGKIGKLEYAVLLPLAIALQIPLLSVVIVNELVASAFIAGDGVLNYGLSVPRLLRRSFAPR